MPERIYLLDTGPLVAYLSEHDEHHEWAVHTFQQITAPFLTTEPVLTEAFYLLSKMKGGTPRVAEFCESGVLDVQFDLLKEMPALKSLLQKYSNVPMDLADATLVHLAEKQRGALLLTTDHDFLVYRTQSRRQIPLVAPFSGEFRPRR